MPFNRPALATLINRVAADVAARLPRDETLRWDDAQVYARAEAGAVDGLYGYLDYIARMVIYDTAEGAELERWASIWGITRRPAASATGTVTFTVGAGAAIAAGAVLATYDGTQYQTTADATVSGSSATAPVSALVAGAAGNRDAGVALTLTSPIAGVQSVATAGELSGGADIETDAALLARLLARLRTPPQGGAANDYIAWALEVPGVTRAWVYPLELGPGTVTVRFVRDDDDSIIPGTDEVAAVAAHIDPLRPVTAAVTVVAPVAVPLDFEFSDLSPDSTSVRAAVAAALAALILAEAVPGGTLLLSHIRAAISEAAGENDYILVSPSANVTHATGEMAVMGDITWP